MTRRLLLALVLCAAPAAAQIAPYHASVRPDCGTKPFIVLVRDGDGSCSNSSGGGLNTYCVCPGNSTYFAISAGGGGGLSSTDIDTSAELRTLVTDEVGTGALMFVGSNATTATAFAANGANCLAGSYPLGVDASGASESCTAISARPLSWDNPPASPSAYDDEFNSGSLNGKWSTDSAGTTNPIASGSVDYTASLTTPIYDAATDPGWILFQSDNSAGGRAGIIETISVATNATFFVKFAGVNSTISADQESALRMEIVMSSDSNERVTIRAHRPSGFGVACDLFVENNGSISNVASAGYTENEPIGPLYMVIWKSGNTYYGACSYGPSNVLMPFGSVPKTGVTSGWDGLRLNLITANETPSKVGGIDFVRYYPSLVYGLNNP